VTFLAAARSLAPFNGETRGHMPASEVLFLDGGIPALRCGAISIRSLTIFSSGSSAGLDVSRRIPRNAWEPSRPEQAMQQHVGESR